MAAAAIGVAAGPAHAAYTTHIQAGTLQITGDGASEKLALRLQPGSPSFLLVDVGADGTAEFSIDRSTFTAISVRAGGGDDDVIIDQSGGSFADEHVTIDGGNGDDNLQGGDGAETLIGGKGDDHVDGNRGSDTALLGAGDDVFQWDPGDGSDTVEGQGGKDRLDFNGSNIGEKIGVTANGSRVRLTRDVAAITMDLDGVDTVALRTLGGADTTTVGDLTGTDTRHVDVDLSANGGGGDASADTVVAQGTDDADKVGFTNTGGGLAVTGLFAQTRVTGDEAADVFDVQTLGGDDTLTAAVGETANGAVRLDGGTGTDTARYNGTSGDDQVGIATDGARSNVFSPGSVTLQSDASDESLVVAGQDGDDAITGQNGISTFTPLTIDGGNGDDNLQGGDGADLLLGGKGDDHVDGNRGSDTALLGAGDDVFQWDPGDGSDIVEGQGGNNRLDFNGSNIGEKIAVEANGDRVRLTRDVAAITMDLDGIDTVAVRALGGADTITVGDLTGTATKQVDADLAAFDGSGDLSADTVIATGRDRRDVVRVTAAGNAVEVAGLPAGIEITGSEPTLDTLVVRTLGGDDDVLVSPEAAALIATVVDLGPDE